MESRKRGVYDLDVYPSKKRSLSSSEQLGKPVPAPLGSSLLLKKPIDANKENCPPSIYLGRRLDNFEAHPTTLDNVGDRNNKLKQPTSLQQASVVDKGSANFVDFKSRSLSTDDTPRAKTSRGEEWTVRLKQNTKPIPFEQLIGRRSSHVAGEAKKSFYGIDIHTLLDQVDSTSETAEGRAHDVGSSKVQPSVEEPPYAQYPRRDREMLWTEKYRARKFTDLVGDDRTHRDVLRWLKGWDSIVFPGSAKPKTKHKLQGAGAESRPHRTVLMLAGPPGLGKTTMAHVCAKQAGYEVLEINASDERSRDVVKGRIKDCVGTDNVKGINTKTDGGKIRKKGRPFCVIVDEVDGAVSGGSGGEGGFVKALIDLVMLDQKNSNTLSTAPGKLIRANRKGDKFRLLRPMILICNDVYHPSLRSLRTTTVAEIIHIRKPPLDKLVTRLGFVFGQEGIHHDKDGVRQLCEATWGLGNQRERTSQSGGTGEGDMRSILVAAEWVALKLRQSRGKSPRLTRKWIEDNVLHSLSHDGGGARGMGRGGAKEAVKRVFQDGAGFSRSEIVATSQINGSVPEIGDAQGVSQAAKRTAMQRLQEIVDASGDSDRIITDCFAAYPSHQYQDDTFLSKPNAAHDWLHFHDRLSLRIHSGQEWELGAYLSQSVLGLHHLFASPAKQFGDGDQRRWNEEAEGEPSLFSGPRADHEASEAMKENKAILFGFQSSLSTSLLRSFRSAEISTDLLPNIIKMLTPDVKPIIVGGSGDQRGVVSVRKEGEREMIQRAVSVMSAVGINFERSRVDAGMAGTSTYIFRMEPYVGTFATHE